MTVNVRFTNNKNHNEDFEQQFTATQSLRDYTESECCAGGTGNTDGEGSLRSDLQPYRSQLVILS